MHQACKTKTLKRYRSCAVESLTKKQGSVVSYNIASHDIGRLSFNLGISSMLESVNFLSFVAAMQWYTLSAITSAYILSIASTLQCCICYVSISRLCSKKKQNFSDAASQVNKYFESIIPYSGLQDVNMKGLGYFYNQLL